MRMFLTEYSIIHKSFSNKIVLSPSNQADGPRSLLSLHQTNFQNNAHLTKAVRTSAPYEKILLLYKTEKDLNILL